MSTKIHASVDKFGRPTRLIFTGGEVHDSKIALELLADRTADAVLADKGYDTNAIIDRVAEIGAIAVIPPTKSRKIQRAYNKEIYRERNLVERYFGRLKRSRRVSTRYDKLIATYAGFVFFESIMIWLS